MCENENGKEWNAPGAEPYLKLFKQIQTVLKKKQTPTAMSAAEIRGCSLRWDIATNFKLVARHLL